VNKYRVKGGLSPYYFHHLNPIVIISDESYKGMGDYSRKEAEKAEKSLAEELRSEGHAVHYN